MVSKLSKRIEEFDLRLRQLESTEPSRASAEQGLSFKAVIELTSLVLELSRKIDQQQEAAALQR